MELRINETAAGLSLEIGDELPLGSHTKAHTTQLLDDRALGGIIPVEEAEDMRLGI